MVYTRHPGIASGELIKAQDIHEMDEQIYKNSEDITEQSQQIADKISISVQKEKTTGMTSPVGIDDDGKLWSTPGGGSGGGAVDSVNGMTGDVVLDAEDVGALPDDTVIPTALSQLSADATHQLVTDAEKTTWNAKGTYSKPSDGIPKTDLDSGVQESLEKADSALQEHQDISGKENTTNKVTALSASSTDAQYPSAKCVYDLVGNIESLLEELL